MPISRVLSGVPGLDPLIEGGFPAPSVILVCGPAGSGKSTFALQFLMNGARHGEKGIYITTLSERAEWMFRFMSAFEFFDPKYFENGTVSYVDIGDELADMDETKILRILRKKIAEETPQRIVIDPINVVNTYVKNYRQFLFDLVTMLKYWNAVTVITGEVKGNEEYPEDVAYASDGIIRLIMRNEGDIIKRYVRVLKMRGTMHSMSSHPLEITQQGIAVLKARF